MKCFVGILLLTLLFGCNSGKKSSPTQRNCVVDNADLFEDLALTVLYHKYGKKNIVTQRPYTLELKGDSIWTLEGSRLIGVDGGVFYIEMSCKDGRILKLEHSR